MPEAGKRVSWVELYLDLVFVLAVGELAHLIVAAPERSTVWVTLGLFLPLWSRGSGSLPPAVEPAVATAGGHDDG